MATKKITQGTIKRLVKEGAAIDMEALKKRPHTTELDTLGISYGINGMNGGLFRHRKNGKLYAITTRGSLLFEYA